MMVLQVQDFREVPATTAALAHKVFPQGHPYLTLRDQLGPVYTDAQFAELFTSARGRPAESPACLALVLILEFAEELSDSDAALQVRARIDWKYLLGLELEDPGFDASVLAEFRQRLVAGHLEAQLLDTLLTRVAALGLLKKRGRQRTDSTHLLAATAQLNRLELVGETLRAALESLAVAAPQWLQAQVPPDWYDRYATRFVRGRHPHSDAERTQWAEQIATDGVQLFTWLREAPAPAWLRELPAVETLRQIWLQQYVWDETRWRWRTTAEQPSHTALLISPYEPEARYSRKRDTEWCGYKTHLTETCDPDFPRLITNVETGNAAAPDHQMTATIHQHLAAHDCLPTEHLVDSGYLDAAEIVTAQTDHAVVLLGPVPADTAWQAQAEKGYALKVFGIDWTAQQVTCPQGHVSKSWREGQDARGRSQIQVRFARAHCQACPVREHCTRSAARTLSLRPRAQHEALQQRRQVQTTPEFRQAYQARAGIEGTVSCAVRVTGLRRARYIGHAKTHLQNVATAIALNWQRLADWWTDLRPRGTRTTHFAALQPV